LHREIPLFCEKIEQKFLGTLKVHTDKSFGMSMIFTLTPLKDKTKAVIKCEEVVPFT